MESTSLFDPDDHEWYSIRIHETSQEDIELSFQEFCEDQSIERYLLCYEEQAAKPHYHSMIECNLAKKKKYVISIITYSKNILPRYMVINPLRGPHVMDPRECFSIYVKRAISALTPHILQKKS